MSLLMLQIQKRILVIGNDPSYKRLGPSRGVPITFLLFNEELFVYFIKKYTSYILFNEICFN